MSTELLTIDPTPINEAHRRCLAAYTSALDEAIQCGALLEDAKIRIGRGNWEQWLANHFEASTRTAQMYMRLWRYREQIREVQKRKGLAHLGVEEATKLIAEPKPKPEPKPAQENPPAPEPGPSSDPHGDRVGGSGGVEDEPEDSYENAPGSPAEAFEQDGGELPDEDGVTPSERLMEALKEEVRAWLGPGDVSPAVAAAICESVAAWIRSVDW